MALVSRSPSYQGQLVSSYVLASDTQICAGGCRLSETTSHLFLHCNFFGLVWNHILRWLGVVAVLPMEAACHFYQFSFLGGAARSRRSILQVIWFATAWAIWKERNNRIFNAKDCSILQVVDKIKAVTYRWLRVKFISLAFNYRGWWLNPFTIIGIG